VEFVRELRYFLKHNVMYSLLLQADLFLAPQLDGATKRFNVDMVLLIL
jgi:hypothetical protein